MNSSPHLTRVTADLSHCEGGQRYILVWLQGQVETILRVSDQQGNTGVKVASNVQEFPEQQPQLESSLA
jgi:hypothetical protein